MERGPVQSQAQQPEQQAHRTSPSPPFVDLQTLQALAWENVWAQFQPATPSGVRWKANVGPFLPGDEAALSLIWNHLAQDVGLLSPAQTQDLRNQLRNLPDIEDTLVSLESGGESPGLSPKHLLGLKQFAFYGNRLLQLSADVGLYWTQRQRWERLLGEFGCIETASFSLEHILEGPLGREWVHTYRSLVKAEAKAVHDIAEATRTRHQVWFDKTGEPVRRDGQLVLPLPLKCDVAEKLKTESGTRWLRDTPFESVFEVPDTEAMITCALQLAAAQEHRKTLEEQLVARFVANLRANLPDWQAVVEDVRNVDLRLSRVLLASTWQGCVPRWTESVMSGDGRKPLSLGEPTAPIELIRGRHPVVVERLEAQGLKYVPLDLRMAGGASVIFGSNMGGKTVAMSLLGLCQVCVQYGLPVPATDFATRLFPVVRFCGNAETDFATGLSSFGTEVTRISQAWSDVQSAGAGLIFLDEPGRSTNPMEGEALAVGVLRAAVELGTHTVLLMATHFSAVLREAGVKKFRVRGLQEGWRAEVGPHQNKLDQLAEWMDYRVEAIEDERVSGLEALPIAEWLGLPQTVLHESKDFLQRRRKP